MRWEDLPESKNVADRRGVREPETLSEVMEQGSQEPKPERGVPYYDSDLAKQAGIGDLTKKPGSVLAVLRTLAAFLTHRQPRI